MTRIETTCDQCFGFGCDWCFSGSDWGLAHPIHRGTRHD
jgi:hypothetical protein